MRSREHIFVASPKHVDIVLFYAPTGSEVVNEVFSVV